MLFIIIIIIIIITFMQVFTIIYVKQIMFLGYRVLQLFWIYSLRYM
jgi:hypothetical protein